MDHDDIDTRSARPGRTAADPASLRGALCTAVERIGELDAERNRLSETRDEVEMMRRDVEGRLAEAERGLARMQAAVHACHQRAGELEAEADAAGQELAALERRERSLTHRLAALTGEADALAREQETRVAAAATLAPALDEICDTVQRIDDKLRFADRKHEAVHEPAADDGRP